MATLEKRLRNNGKIIARLNLDKRDAVFVLHHENGLTIALDLVEALTLINLLATTEHALLRLSKELDQQTRDKAALAEWDAK